MFHFTKVNRKGDNREMVHEEIIQIFGLKKVFKDLYLEGWCPADEKFGKILIAALQEGGNCIAHRNETILVRLISKQFCEYRRTDQLIINVYSAA
jgi:hypothetical protein